VRVARQGNERKKGFDWLDSIGDFEFANLDGTSRKLPLDSQGGRRTFAVMASVKKGRKVAFWGARLVRAERLVALLFLLIPPLAQAQFSWTVGNGQVAQGTTATITGYYGPGGTVIIPSSVSITNQQFVTNYPVTAIGCLAFAYGDTVTNLIIPDSVLDIQNDAFSYCHNLTNVTIGNGVTNVSSSDFFDCVRLASITVGSNNADYSSSNGILFDKNQVTLVQFPPALRGSYTTPSSVIRIGSSAFEHSSLAEVVLTNDVVCIGSNAFLGCILLKNFTVPASVTNIGPQALASCAGMQAITVATNNPFYCSVNGVLLDKNETTVIQSPAALSGSYLIPDTVVNIGDCAFLNDFVLHSVAIPEGVTNIGNRAFDLCLGLGQAAIPPSVVTIGNYAFCETHLTNVVVPDLTVSIGDDAFLGCYNLSSVNISASVTNIGAYAFNACANLTNIAVATDNSFYSSLNGVLFDKNMTTLVTFPGGKPGNYTIPDTVTNINEYAFYECSALASVTIPACVSNIGDNNFIQCYTLTNIYFTGNAPTVASSSFSGDAPGAAIYYLPSATGWSGFGQSIGIQVPVVLWLPQIQTSDANFGVRTNQFGFDIDWASGQNIVIEACTNFSHPVWIPLQTYRLTNGSIYFNDPQWTNYPARFYRISSP
jgi:hypothetical protein